MFELEERRPASVLALRNRGRLFPCDASSHTACTRFARQRHSPKPRSAAEEEAHSIIAPSMATSSLPCAVPLKARQITQSLSQNQVFHQTHSKQQPLALLQLEPMRWKLATSSSSMTATDLLLRFPTAGTTMAVSISISQPPTASTRGSNPIGIERKRLALFRKQSISMGWGSTICSTPISDRVVDGLK